MAPSPACSRPAALRLTPACDLGEVRATAAAVRQFLAGQGCGEADLNACELALVEACNNAVKYAAPTATPHPLRVDCSCDPLHIELRVQDHTPGFDWPARVKLPDPECESGRGVYLIQALMDEAHYFRGAGSNVLLLSKRRTAAPFPSPTAPADSEHIIGELVEELSSCYESLSAIFRYSTAQPNLGDLKEFARRLMSDLMQITNADWFVLRLAPEGGARLDIFTTSVGGQLPPALAVANPAPGAASVECDAARSRHVVWFDATHPLSPADPLAEVHPGSRGLVHPIFSAENLIGTLTLGRRAPHADGLVFTAGQTNVVGTFAEFLAIQVVNARFHEERVAGRLVAHELEIANNIQKSLLPRELPTVPGFQLAANCRSAHQVGGDFYDVLRLNEHELLLVIADVMGKGVPAAMFAAILRTMVRAAPELAQQPAALLGRVNRLLFDELSGVDMFITAQLGYLDVRGPRLTIASAGHCPLLVAANGDSEVREYSPEGMPLGILHDTEFVEEVVTLGPRCRLLLYTDGLPEALNAQGQRFGQERLSQWLAAHAREQASAQALEASLTTLLGEFQANLVLNDDQTFLILCG